MDGYWTINPFNNGLIIQFGFAYGYDYAAPITFPIAFNSPYYCMVACAELYTWDFEGLVKGTLFEYRTVSGILVRISHVDGPNIRYICIGC